MRSWPRSGAARRIPSARCWKNGLGRWGNGLPAGSNPAANLAAGNDADGVPVSVRNATRLLWETARREADDVQRQELESARGQLEEAGNVLAVGQADLSQREAAFEQARASLDAALASSQQARDTLERQLAEHTAEIARLRAASEQEIARLNAPLQASHAGKEVLRQEQAAALAARDKHFKKERERHVAQERHSHEEVDRARQAAKQLEAGLAKEQQQRIQSEEAAAQTLEAGRRMLRETQQAAQQVERDLRDQLTHQASVLAHAQAEGTALAHRLDDLVRQLGEEKKAHKGTRALLASALASARKEDSRKGGIGPKIKRPKA